MTVFEVSVKIESMRESISSSYALTFTSQEGFYDCWEQIERFKNLKFDDKPTITHVLNTASFDVHEQNW
jgi:hypothetical protein